MRENMAENSNEDVFLAEKVIDSGFGQQDGKRYYKVKWVRYTWESEDTLAHLKDLLDQFWEEHGDLQNKLKIPESINVNQGDIKGSSDTTLAEVNSVDRENATNVVTSESGLAVSVLLKNENPDEVMFSESVRLPATDTKLASFPEKSGKHSCDVCMRSYSSQQSLKHHKRTHHRTEKSFQCSTCLKYFVERSTLKRHMLIHLEEKPYKCEYCDRAFSDKSTLRRHIVTHTGAKRFVCTNCDKRFTRNEHLRQHMYIHTAEKLYKCEVCSKDFRQRSTLKNHMLVHRSEKTLKWKCENCAALFELQSEYDEHFVLCEKTNNNKCESCDKLFPDSDSLMRHLMIHTGEAHKCDCCEETFNDKTALDNHHEFVHKKNMKCLLCDETFETKDALLAHMSSLHPQQTVYELVDPGVNYQISDDGDIGLDDQSLSHPVRYVLRNNALNIDQVDIRDVSISQVEISTDASQSEASMHSKQTSLGLQPGDNQLLQVELVRMEDGNQFVQSIQTYVQDDQSDLSSQTRDQLLTNDNLILPVVESGEFPKEDELENKDDVEKKSKKEE